MGYIIITPLCIGMHVSEYLSIGHCCSELFVALHVVVNGDKESWRETNGRYSVHNISQATERDRMSFARSHWHSGVG